MVGALRGTLEWSGGTNPRGCNLRPYPADAVFSGTGFRLSAMNERRKSDHFGVVRPPFATNRAVATKSRGLDFRPLYNAQVTALRSRFSRPISR